jgi:uncharacterized protein
MTEVIEQKSLNYRKLAEVVLSTTRKPMNAKEIYQYYKESKIADIYKVKKESADPESAIYYALNYVVNTKDDTCIKKVENTRPFKWYNEKLIDRDELKKLEEQTSVDEDDNEQFNSEDVYIKEKDLHKILTEYVKEKEEIFTKTIVAQRSKRNLIKGDWLHPDIVGVKYPKKGESYGDSIIRLARSIGNQIVTLYSYELKLEINWANYKKHFFQAVSNSSWANEGYLVVLHIEKDPLFYQELKRLTSAFGIGIIQLDIENIENCQVLFPSRINSELDWNTITTLADKNRDFIQFLNRVRVDAEHADAWEHEHLYD